MSKNTIKIGEGLYYNVYKISETRVFKKEKSYWRKQATFLKWFMFSYFFRNLFRPNRYEKHLLDSKIVATRVNNLIGNPIFKDRYNYEQDIVVSLEEYFKNNLEKENQEKFEEFISLTYKTWEHGFSDIVFNFTYNNGVNKDGVVVLHDFNEVTFDKDIILNKIKRKFWLGQSSFTTFPEGSFKEYIRKRLDETFTQETLDKYWKS